MISYVDGDILSSLCDAIVIPVNCVGVMGAGLARHYARHHPVGEIFYRRACRMQVLRPGVCVYHDRLMPPTIFFPTKNHWSQPSDLDDIARGLTSLVAIVAASDIMTLAIPALGCGLGGLSWEEVRPVLESGLDPLLIEIDLFLPKDLRSAKDRLQAPQPAQ